MKKYSSLIAGIVVLVSVFLALKLQVPPSVTTSSDVGVSLPETEFSTERAMVHVREIAQKPHPVESEENARIRGYITSILQDQMGLKVEEQTGQFLRAARGKRPERMFQLTNLYSKLPGSEPGPGILLVAHHDSVPSGPGAADDTSNVAAMLEAVRTLQFRGTLKRDIHLLLTDGEEYGLLGARVFVRDHPEFLENVALVFNFEARGVSGPAFMFESSGANAELISAFSKHGFFPIGNSLADYVYQRMPNNTDFTIFRRAGMAGFNFAFIDGSKHYHQPTDNIENLDPRSMQQVGKIMVEFCEHLGNLQSLPATDLEAGVGRAVFFNLIGSTMVHYPMGLPVALSVVLLLILVLSPFLINKSANEKVAPWRFVSILLGLLKALAVVLVSVALAVLLVYLARRGRWPIDTVHIGAWITLSISILFAYFAHLSWSKKSPQSAEVLVVIAGILMGFLLPEGSYLFQWTGVFVGIGWLFQSMGKPRTAHTCQWIALLVAIFIHAPTIYYIFIAYPPALPVLVPLAVMDALLLATLLMGSSDSTAAIQRD